MKEIPQVQFTLKRDGADATGHTTVSMLKYCLDFPPQGGFTPSILRERARIDAACDSIEVGGMLKLEDADFAVARKCVEEARWSLRHPDLLKFFALWGL